MINKNYDFVVRHPHQAARRLTELEAENDKLREALEHARMEEEHANDAAIAKYEKEKS